MPLTLRDLSYGYDQGTGKNNGNVVQIANNRDGTRSVAYTYDELNRIKTARTYNSTRWGDSFGYDAWGNLVSITATQGLGENLAAAVNVKNRVVEYSYDNAGNLTWDGVNALNYDAENRMTPAYGLSYSYDGDSRRVSKSDGTVYWMDDQLQPLSVGDNTGAMRRDYIFFAGQRVALVGIVSGNPHDYLPTSSVRRR